MAPAACFRHQWAVALNKPLVETDPELFDIMEHEKVIKQELHSSSTI